MMKKVFKHIAWMPVLASLLLSWACMKEEFHPEPRPEGALLLHPSVVSMAATKAVNDATTTGVDARAENALGSYLDVFFAGVDTPTFWKEYHLTGRSFTDPAGELISVNWRADGFVAGQRYNVYVVVNGPAAAHSTVGSLSALRAMTHTDNDLYRLKYVSGEDYPDDPSNPNYYYYTNSKSFLMDGVLENWTPTNAHTQTITVNNLKRAAAKIVVNISFKSAFLTELLADNVVPQNAAFKYENFAFCSTVLRSGNTVDPALGTENGKVKFANVNVSDPANEDFHYGIATYSYAFNWTDEALGAPHVLVSIGLKHTGKDGQPVTYHYYRIPVRPQGQTSLQRNSLYIVNAQLDNKGSYTEDDATIPVNLSYQVLEWTAESSEITNVVTDEVHYFIVNPKEIALHGDGAQSVTLRYHAPENAAITIVPIPQSPTNELATEATARTFVTTQTTVEGKGYQAFFIDKDGNPNESSVDGITVSTNPQTITVTSTALANRASKYIRFRAVYTYTENSVEKHINQDIYIRHFPVDYIENVEGKWSSRWEGYEKEYSFNPSWEPDGIEDVWRECDLDTYNAIAESERKKSEVADRDSYTYYTETQTDQNTFQSAIPGTTDQVYRTREGANSLANAVRGTSGEYLNHYYYGTDPSEVGQSWGGSSYDGADYWDSFFDWGWRKHWMAYGKYYEVTYHKTYAKRYWRYTSNPPTPTSGTWVDYEKKTGSTYQDIQLTETYAYKAKVYDNGAIKYLTTNAAIGATVTGSSNNHIYVIQLKASSDFHVIGKPYIVDNQSNDHVVSPAFMIASQLGSILPLPKGEASKNHCSTYMEVGMDGTRYIGWRLPTREEIALIDKYQNSAAANVTLATVLGGAYYWTLDGGDAATITNGSGGTADNAYVRCVRDVTPAEVESMNHIK